MDLDKRSIFYCNVPEMERRMAKEEFEDRLDLNEKKLVKKMTKSGTGEMSEASARNQIYWGNRVKQHATNMIKEGYNMTMEDATMWAQNWGAQI